MPLWERSKMLNPMFKTECGHARAWSNRKVSGRAELLLASPRMVALSLRCHFSDSRKDAPIMATTAVYEDSSLCIEAFMDTPTCPEDYAKQREARRLTARMDSLEIKQCPRTFRHIDDDEQLGKDEGSQGNQYWLDGKQHSEFPQMGFEVWIDGRHNGGDLAQSIVDTLFAIAKLYQRLAESNAGRLERTPSAREVERIAREYHS